MNVVDESECAEKHVTILFVQFTFILALEVTTYNSLVHLFSCDKYQQELSFTDNSGCGTSCMLPCIPTSRKLMHVNA